MKTCIICGENYSNSWFNWQSKFCCKKCYFNTASKYSIGDKVYTYNNSKQGRSGILTANTEVCEIVNIYKLNNPTMNGIYQYACKFESGKVSYRFLHQIFDTIEECDNHVQNVNKKRILMRQVYDLMK